MPHQCEFVGATAEKEVHDKFWKRGADFFLATENEEWILLERPLSEVTKQRMESAFWLTRIVFLRGLGLLCCSAFAMAWNQNIGLIGEKGIIPALAYAKDIWELHGPHWTEVFSHLGLFTFIPPSNTALRVAAVTGILGSLSLVILGCSNMFIIGILWLLYSSLSSVGQVWYWFAEDLDLVIEHVLFGTLFLVPLVSMRQRPQRTPPPRFSLIGLRMLLFYITVRNLNTVLDITLIPLHVGISHQKLAALFPKQANLVDWYLARMLSFEVQHTIWSLLLICDAVSAGVVAFFFPFPWIRRAAGVTHLVCRVLAIFLGKCVLLNVVMLILILFAFDDLFIASFFSEMTLRRLPLQYRTEAICSPFYSFKRFFDEKKEPWTFTSTYAPEKLMTSEVSPTEGHTTSEGGSSGPGASGNSVQETRSATAEQDVAFLISKSESATSQQRNRYQSKYLDADAFGENENRSQMFDWLLSPEQFFYVTPRDSCIGPTLPPSGSLDSPATLLEENAPRLDHYRPSMSQLKSTLSRRSRPLASTASAMSAGSGPESLASKVSMDDQRSGVEDFSAPFPSVGQVSGIDRQQNSGGLCSDQQGAKGTDEYASNLCAHGTLSTQSGGCLALSAVSPREQEYFVSPTGSLLFAFFSVWSTIIQPIALLTQKTSASKNDSGKTAWDIAMDCFCSAIFAVGCALTSTTLALPPPSLSPPNRSSESFALTEWVSSPRIPRSPSVSGFQARCNSAIGSFRRLWRLYRPCIWASVNGCVLIMVKVLCDGRQRSGWNRGVVLMLGILVVLGLVYLERGVDGSAAGVKRWRQRYEQEASRSSESQFSGDVTRTVSPQNAVFTRLNGSEKHVECHAYQLWARIVFIRGFTEVLLCYLLFTLTYPAPFLTLHERHFPRPFWLPHSDTKTVVSQPGSDPPIHMLLNYDERFELVIEGAGVLPLAEQQENKVQSNWVPLQFKCTIESANRRPCVQLPYNYRLDYALIVLAHTTTQDTISTSWLPQFLQRLLQAEVSVMSLIRRIRFNRQRFPTLVTVRVVRNRFRFSRPGIGNVTLWSGKRQNGGERCYSRQQRFNRVCIAAWALLLSKKNLERVSESVVGEDFRRRNDSSYHIKKFPSPSSSSSSSSVQCVLMPTYSPFERAVSKSCGVPFLLVLLIRIIYCVAFVKLS